jgi:two-component system, chemotaxis family, CheB/CheR fusion protein
VTPERLKRFFIRKAAAYKVKEEIRQNIVFAVQNIVKDPPFTKLDLISCRNVLIYFGADLHEKVVPMFQNSLKPGGILFLGSSESIGAHVDMFSVVDRKWKIFRTKGVAARPATPFEMRKKVAAERGAVPAPPALKPHRELSMKEAAEKTVIDRYAPPFVIIDRKGDILYFHGRTTSYLQPPSGRASLNIIEMAREEMRLELRIALRKAIAGKKKITVEGLLVKVDGAIRAVNLEILQPEPLQGQLMVVFRELTFPKGQKAGKASPPSPGMRPQIAELEHELKSTKEQLQTTIEELDTANQELGATNEELQSSNEELQSTIEEMETSKEELQSVNEELTTINTELQLKMDELFQLNNDMNNLITSTQLATIFLDNRLRIKRFTPATVNLLNLMGADVGRYIGDFTLKLDYPDLEKDIGETLRELVLKERVVRHRDGLWYLTRILPYRTTENVIDGAVITFIDVTGQKKAEEAQTAALSYAEGIVETVRESLLVLDSDLRVITANKSFYRAFRTSRNDVEKKLVYDLGNGQWAIPALRELLEKILPENTQIENFEVVHDFPDVGHKKMLLNARRIYEHGKRTLMILLAIEDITGRKK